MDGGYEAKITGYELSLDCLGDSEMKLFDALDYLNKPATDEFMGKQMARLRMVMARSNESNGDMAVLIDTYADRLAEYPPDIVAHVCNKIMDTKKWFPLISELKQEMDSLMIYRRAVLKLFEDLRNPLKQARLTHAQG